MGIKYTEDSLHAAALDAVYRVTYDMAVIIALGVVVLLIRFLWSSRKNREVRPLGK
jgi:heme/copper-type cytochrome/quinol oxidase subunit 2